MSASSPSGVKKLISHGLISVMAQACSMALVIVIGFALLVRFNPATCASAKGEPDASDGFFARSHVIAIKIELPQASVNSLSRQPRLYAHAAVTIDGQAIDDVAIRLRGFGTFRPLSQKPDLAIKLNGFKPRQEFCGLTKLMLNNSAQDATYLCEYLASDLFLKAGVPTPRVAHARVELNRRDLGFYVLTEAVNERFLKRHFKNAKGNLYEGALQDINSRLDVDSGGVQPDPGRPSTATPLGRSSSPNQSDLRALAQAARLPDPILRSQALAARLDVDRFLTFLAVEMMVSNWDGYALYRNNYRVYHDPDSDRMFFIPHGLDNSMHDPYLSIMPPRKSLLVSALMETGAQREIYRSKVAGLLTNIYRVEDILHRLDTATAKLKAAVQTQEEARAFDVRADALRKRILARARQVANEVNGKRPPSLEFDERGVAHLRTWRMDSDWAGSTLAMLPDGRKTTLHISADKGDCTASWRMHLFLPPGPYRLEGIAKTAGVAARGSATGMGAGVRILGAQRGRGLEGDTPWMGVDFDFIIQEGCGNVDLICELRAMRGQAWFDLESLRLIRR